MKKRRQNPPATLTTNATTHKHSEHLFSQGIGIQSQDSKKAGEVKSLEQIGFEYYELIKNKDDVRDDSFSGNENLESREEFVVQEDNFEF